MNLRPVRDRIIVKRLDKETATASGIVLPESSVEKQERGVVLAIGTGEMTDSGIIIPISVNVGDLVLFGKFDGVDTKVDGEEVVILKNDDITAIIEL